MSGYLYVNFLVKAPIYVLSICPLLKLDELMSSINLLLALGEYIIAWDAQKK
jgi:hypothetical protein